MPGHGRHVHLRVSSRGVWLIFAQNVVDGSQEPSGNGNYGFLFPSPLLKSVLLPIDFRMLLTAAGSKSDLNQQWLEIGAGLADTG